MSNENKKTALPKLRFPEFQDAGEWELDFLTGKGVAVFIKEKSPAHALNIDSYVSTENLLSDYGGLTVASKLPTSGSFTKFRKGDILVSNIRPYLKKVWLADVDGASSNDVIVVRAGEKISASFLSFILRNDCFIDYMMKGAEGVKMPRGDKESIREYPLAFPGKKEQQKIAATLSSLDDLITAQSAKLEALKAQRRGLMQGLFPAEGETVPTLRFPEFSDEWKPRELADFITERVEYPTGKLPLYSLTIEDGVTPKIERYERAFLVNNEEAAYKIVCPNDFAYNPMNLRFGAIARHSGDIKVTLSKYYNIFHCDGTVDSKFCEFYFRSQQMITHYDNVATGSLIEKRRVHYSDFLQFKILFPSFEEQEKIADTISSLDNQITAQSQKIEVLKLHKKGLMQHLFPAAAELTA
jgi:type I restriction enzyme S subunit